MPDELHQILASVNKEFGENSVIILDEEKKVRADVIPTGVSIVDNALGVGGIARGKITEVFGAEGCGKTTLCLHTIAQAQKLGLNVAFIDAEHALNYDRMKALGVDTNRLAISQPDSGEQALNIVEMLVRTGKFALIVVDSVAALTPMVEIEKDMGESVMGVHARLMSQAMRKLAAPVNKFNTALMFTNQTRAKIGGYVVGETTTGGNALKFYASLRLQMKYIGKIVNSANERISGKYRMTVVKNKMATPFKEAEFEINETGIDESGNLLDQLVEAGALTKSGSWFQIDGQNVANGKLAMGAYLKENPEIKGKLVQQLHKQD